MKRPSITRLKSEHCSDLWVEKGWLNPSSCPERQTLIWMELPREIIHRTPFLMQRINRNLRLWNRSMPHFTFECLMFYYS